MTAEPSQAGRSSDTGGAVIAALFVIIGAVVYYDTTQYVDLDSVVFPRTVAIALMSFSLIYLLAWLSGRSTLADEQQEGSWLRRIGLVVVMIGAALSMPWAGFIASGLVSFAAIMVIAMFDRWTPFRLVVYPLIGAAIVIGFYLLFAEGLQVPLPRGNLFAG